MFRSGDCCFFMCAAAVACVAVHAVIQRGSKKIDLQSCLGSRLEFASCYFIFNFPGHAKRWTSIENAYHR